MKFLTLPLTKQKTKQRSKKNSQTSKSSFLKFLKNCHWLHWLLIITNYCFYHRCLTLIKIWKTKISAKFWILLLLQTSYIFITSTKDLNVLQISTVNWTFAISFTFLQACECMGLWYRLLNIDVSKSIFWIGQSLFSINTPITNIPSEFFNMNACWSNQY